MRLKVRLDESDNQRVEKTAGSCRLGETALSRRTILYLAAILPAVALADEGRISSRRGGSRRPEVAASLVENRAVRENDPRERPDPVFLGRLLRPFPILETPPKANPLGAYLPGPAYPRALEAVATHLVLREAGRHWRRYARRTLKERFSADPSYSAMNLEDDMDRLRRGWTFRRILARPRLRLGTQAPAPPKPAENRNLLENRFVTIDRDLRLRLHLQEVVGIVIGDGPEDDYTFESVPSESSMASRPRSRSRLPRVQIRGRAKLHLDQKALMDLDSSRGYFDRYGAQVSVHFLGRRSSEKIFSAYVGIGASHRKGTELTLSLRRRF